MIYGYIATLIFIGYIVWITRSHKPELLSEKDAKAIQDKIDEFTSHINYTFQDGLKSLREERAKK